MQYKFSTQVEVNARNKIYVKCLFSLMVLAPMKSDEKSYSSKKN